MFTIKPTISGWIAADGSGKRFNDRQAATLLYRESAAFMDAVQKHLRLDQCSHCRYWGQVEFDLFILHGGAKPICGKPDCLAARLHNDYTSTDIISLAALGRQRKIDLAWDTITAIEPMIRFVREFMDRLEICHKYESSDPRIRRRFAADFAEIDGAAAEVLV